MSARIVGILAVALLMAPQSPGPAQAEGRHEEADQDAALRALQRHEVLPLSRILQLAARRVPGDVIKVKLKREDGRIVYEIKVLAKTGRIREIIFDARTGGILKIEDD